MVGQVEAIEIAKSYIQGMPFKDAYRLDAAEIHDAGEYWECWFPTAKPSRPAYGIVAVHKRTGAAIWRPNR